MQFRKKHPEVIVNAMQWEGGAESAAAVIDWANSQELSCGRSIYAPASGGHAEVILLYRGPSLRSHLVKPGQFLVLHHDEESGDSKLAVYKPEEFLADYEKVAVPAALDSVVTLSASGGATLGAPGRWMTMVEIGDMKSEQFQAGYKSGYDTGHMHGGGWTAWEPGSGSKPLQPPQIPYDTRVDVRLRNGAVQRDGRAGYYNWQHGPGSGLSGAEYEIVAWRYTSHPNGVRDGYDVIDPNPPVESSVDTMPADEGKPEPAGEDAAGESPSTVSNAIDRLLCATLRQGVGVFHLSPLDVSELLQFVVPGPTLSVKREHKWRKWGGGERPAESFGLAMVEYVTHLGQVRMKNPNDLRWSHEGLDSDIQAWRPA